MTANPAIQAPFGCSALDALPQANAATKADPARALPFTGANVAAGVQLNVPNDISIAAAGHIFTWSPTSPVRGADARSDPHHEPPASGQTATLPPPSTPPNSTLPPNEEIDVAQALPAKRRPPSGAAANEPTEPASLPQGETAALNLAT
jgi:hypothetical protein